MSERSYFELISKSENKVVHPAGHVIFEQGDSGTQMFVLVSGRVDLKVGDAVVQSLEGGEIFGEMALVDSEPRSATAVTAVESELVPIDAAEFQYMLRRIPFFGLEVMRVMAQRLRRSTKQAAS